MSKIKKSHSLRTVKVNANQSCCIHIAIVLCTISRVRIQMSPFAATQMLNVCVESIVKFDQIEMTHSSVMAAWLDAFRSITIRPIRRPWSSTKCRSCNVEICRNKKLLCFMFTMVAPRFAIKRGMNWWGLPSFCVRTLLTFYYIFLLWLWQCEKR